MDTSAGFLLGGRVRYVQPVDGYRTGIEPVLLAASIPATSGQRVLEAGTGAGAALLCLAARIPGLHGVGIEQDPTMADLARQNMAANAAPFLIHTSDITHFPALPAFDHVFANPPWHNPASTRPIDSMRGAATHRTGGGLREWIDALGALVAPRGTLSFALPASLAGEAIRLLHQAGLGRIALFPLWPRAGRPAKIVLLRAKHGAGPSVIAAGMVLHGAGSSYTEAAEGVLRGGAAIPFGDPVARRAAIRPVHQDGSARHVGLREEQQDQPVI